MDPVKQLKLLFTNGDTIIKGKADNNEVYRNWYIQAEKLLPNIFGND
jgi:hypothetical protein